MKAELHKGHGQKGDREIHAVFEDYVSKRDDAGCWCKGYKKGNDAERDKPHPPMGKKGEDEQKEKKEERCKRLQRQETRGQWVVPVHILVGRPEKELQIGKKHRELGKKILFSGERKSWTRIVEEAGSD